MSEKIDSKEAIVEYKKRRLSLLLEKLKSLDESSNKEANNYINEINEINKYLHDTQNWSWIKLFYGTMSILPYIINILIFYIFYYLVAHYNKINIEVVHDNLLIPIFILIFLWIAKKNYKKNKKNDILDASNNIHNRYEEIYGKHLGYTNFDGKPLVRKSKLNPYNTEKMVIMDMFIEKEIDVLTKRANKLENSGNMFIVIAVMFLVFGTVLSLMQMLNLTPTIIKHFIPDFKTSNILQYYTESKDIWVFLPIFIKSFTAYGMIVLTSVTLLKFGKAKLDQLERTYGKRQFNRILRTFAHLKEKVIAIKDIKDLADIFMVNSSAYSHLNVDAKAPVGAVLASKIDLLKDIISKKNKRSDDNSSTEKRDIEDNFSKMHNANIKENGESTKQNRKFEVGTETRGISK